MFTFFFWLFLSNIALDYLVSSAVPCINKTCAVYHTIISVKVGSIEFCASRLLFGDALVFF